MNKVIILLLVLFGCSTTPPAPLSYLAIKRPAGVIKASKGEEVKKEFGRGGMYFLNFNFRPAPDLTVYLQEGAEKKELLTDVDVQLNTPFAFDLLLFGYNHSTDYLYINRKAKKEDN